MAKQILNGHIVDDFYFFVEEIEQIEGHDHVLLPLSLYQQYHDRLQHTKGKLGVRVTTDEALENLIPFLNELSLIDIFYPSFTDGRGHSMARLLRESHDFKGVIRASGDVFRDTVFYLKRCGINAFLIKETETLEGALKGLKVFTENYQADVDQLPLFRRRQQLLAA